MNYPRNPLQQLIPSRVKPLLPRLYERVWEGRQDLDVLGGPVHDQPIPVEDARRQEMTPVAPGETFAGPGDTWRQRWFKITVPPAVEDEKGRRVLFWDSQGETTVHIDGTPWAGIDIAHRYCTLPDDACELWLDTGTYQTAIWFDAPKNVVDEFGCRFDGAWLCCRNELAWETYWDLSCMVELMQHLLSRQGWEGPHVGQKQPLDQASVVLRILLERLDRACDAYETKGLAALAQELKETYQALPAVAWQGRAGLCGHAHIDLVWLWPESVGERKAVHSFSTVLRLMEQYPEFRFTHSQPPSYQAVRRQAPGLYDRILARVRAGQWEATGGFEVESDVNLPCGEALARGLYYGQQRFAEMRDGAISRTVWIPDVFGYSNCLPQIMKLGGIESFFTTKMTWSSVTRFPHNAFRWRGADDSEILTFLCPVGYNGRVDFESLTSAMEGHRQSGVFDEALLPQGVGDGGGGPTVEMCERARRFSNMPVAPRARWTRVEDYFDRLNEAREDLPVYRGELYLELHRGILTTQSTFKFNYRSAEKALQAHEAVRVLKGGSAVDADDWRRLCFAQFHDALPGSSIGLVYEQLSPELEALTKRHLEAAQKEFAGTNPDASSVCIFNPLPLPRSVVVKNPNKHRETSLKQVSADGRVQASAQVQQMGAAAADSALVRVFLPALGSVELTETNSAEESPSDWHVAPDALDNGRVHAEFDGNGTLSALVIDGEPILLASPAEFRLYPDNPASWDAWDIDRHTLALGQPCAAPVELEVTESGPVRACLKGTVAVGDKSRMTIAYMVEADSPYLMVDVNVAWREDRKLLKYHLPTQYSGRFARYGAPFGSTLRPQVPGHSNDESQWEVPGSRWVAVFDDGEDSGMAVMTEAKYGFSCRDGDLGISLLRAPKHPDPNADHGEHLIRYAIGNYRRHTEGKELNTAAAAEALYSPVIVSRGGCVCDPPLTLHEPRSLVPVNVHPAENHNGWILRLHETVGDRGEAILELRDSGREVVAVDFLEREIGTFEEVDERRFKLPYTPYRILSVLVRDADHGTEGGCSRKSAKTT